MTVSQSCFLSLPQFSSVFLSAKIDAGNANFLPQLVPQFTPPYVVGGITEELRGIGAVQVSEDAASSVGSSVAEGA